MSEIHVIADEETLKAFLIGSVPGTVSSPETIEEDIERIIAEETPVLLMVSNEYMKRKDRFIYKINQDKLLPIIISIPPLKEITTDEKSVMDYITEAIGFSL